MASGSSKSNKSELVAIYRLEFYRNKKNWKFHNERKKEESQQIPSKSPRTKSTQDLNKTYIVETSSNFESENSPLNNAFMHEIPTDDSPENVPLATLPTPHPPEKTWQQQEAEAGQRSPFAGTWVNRRILTYSETHPEIQNKETLAGCRTDAVQQTPLTPSINQNQPVSNSLHLLKTNIESVENLFKIESNSPKPNFWTNNQASTQDLRSQQPWSNQTDINSSSNYSKNIWTGAPSTSSERVQKSSSAQSLASPLSNTEILASLRKVHTQNVEYQKYNRIPLGPPAVNLQMLLCQDKWNNREMAVHQDDQANSSKINPGLWTNPALVARPAFEQNNHPNIPSQWSNEVLSPPPFSRRFNPDIYHNDQNSSQKLPSKPQNGSQLISQVSFTDQGSETENCNLVIPEHNSPNTFQDSKPDRPPLWTWNLKSREELELTSPSPSREKYPIATWCGSQEEPRAWNDPALSSNPDVIKPYAWSNEGLQKQEDSYLHQEWPPTFDDIPNCERREEFDQGDLQHTAVDQNTLKPQGSVDTQMLTPEQVRQFTDEWLRRLLALYRPNDNCHIEDETSSEQNQGVHSDSTDFIREAHEVPHSSEKDPDETIECVCCCLRRAARVTRTLLSEQIARDRLRSSTLLDSVEYPTRDTDLFGSEYVMGGSHVPHSTRDLEPEGGRVIGIDMGRPYRL